MKSLFAGAALAALIACPAFAALEPGAAAPDFSADGHKDGQPYHFDLTQARAEGPVVLYFFPGANTPGCDIEAQQFAAAMDRFEAEGAMVVGATAMIARPGDMANSFTGDDLHSEDAQAVLAEYSQTMCDGKFPVMAVGADTIAAYDVTMERGAARLTSRTSYVISPEGEVLFSLTEGAPGPHIEQTLEAVKAWNAAHGEHAH